MFLVEENVSAKLLPCLYRGSVLCSYRKDARVRIMARCDNCPEYRRFKREMDEEDKRIMDEIDEIYRTGVWK